MRRPRPLPNTRSLDIGKLIRRREELIKARRSTAILDREINLAVCRQIRREVREEMAS